MAAPVARVFEAFVDPELRARWLPGVDLRERGTQPNKSARFDLPDGSRLAVTFAASGDKCQVAVEQERLPDAESAQRAKEVWRGRLTALRTMLQA